MFASADVSRIAAVEASIDSVQANISVGHQHVGVTQANKDGAAVVKNL